MDLELSGKVVLVTGGAKGIGAAMVQAFAVEGGKVAVIDRDQEAGVALGESLGAEVQFIAADLSEGQACRQAVEQTVAAFGGVDVLVNNAGFNDGLGLEASPEQFMSSVRSNLLHVYAMTHHALPYLRTGRAASLTSARRLRSQGRATPPDMPLRRVRSTRSHENGPWPWLQRGHSRQLRFACGVPDRSV